jgi:hypothetical protein
MTTKENASQDRNKTESAESTPCRKCKGTGVILQINVSHTEAICCGQCSGGNRIWSRLLELLADVDTPSPVSARPEKTDSIVRDQLPRRHPWPTSGPAGVKNRR